MAQSRVLLVLGLAVFLSLLAGTAWWLSRGTGTAARVQRVAALCPRAGGERIRTAAGPLLYVRTAGSAPFPAAGTAANRVWAAGTVRSFTVEVANRCRRVDGPRAWLTAVQATTIQSSALAGDIGIEVLLPDPARGDRLVAVARGPLTRFLAGPVPLAWPAPAGHVPIQPGQDECLALRVRLGSGAEGAGRAAASEVAAFAVSSRAAGG